MNSRALEPTQDSHALVPEKIDFPIWHDFAGVDNAAKRRKAREDNFTRDLDSARASSSPSSSSTTTSTLAEWLEGGCRGELALRAVKKEFRGGISDFLARPTDVSIRFLLSLSLSTYFADLCKSVNGFERIEEKSARRIVVALVLVARRKNQIFLQLLRTLSFRELSENHL